MPCVHPRVTTAEVQFKRILSFGAPQPHHLGTIDLYYMRSKIMTKHTSRTRFLNRRGFLRAGLTGGTALAAMSVLDVSDVFAVEVEDSPQSVFSYGVWVERLATTFYYTVLTRAAFSINAADKNTLK